MTCQECGYTGGIILVRGDGDEFGYCLHCGSEGEDIPQS
jgi:hypothetical protein